MAYLILLSIVTLIASHARASNEECPAIFLRFSKIHSYCKPANPKCEILKSSVSQKEIEVILKEHNLFRRRIAMGEEKLLPKASNMLQLEWDNELSAVAQKHANQCEFEHDCADCRRVWNFAVGQNIASEYVTNSPSVPESNWALAIKNWYNEVQYFKSNRIDPFIQPGPPPEPTYGHFTQVVWAETWRVGCGYVLFKEKNDYKKIYVCNYGPAGNMSPGSMYKQGQTCSQCPENSCCGKTCSTGADYEGLCKVNMNEAPVYKPKGTFFFYCNFQNQPDCNIPITTGANKWKIHNTLSEGFLGIILKGGEESSITFGTKLKPPSAQFCFVILYRKGPNKAGDADNCRATETFKIVDNNFEVSQDLTSFDLPFRHEFNQFSLNMAWSYETEVKLTFSVPPGIPDQFFDIKEVYAYNGVCRK